MQSSQGCFCHHKPRWKHVRGVDAFLAQECAQCLKFFALKSPCCFSILIAATYTRVLKRIHEEHSTEDHFVLTTIYPHQRILHGGSSVDAKY